MLYRENVCTWVHMEARKGCWVSSSISCIYSFEVRSLHKHGAHVSMARLKVSKLKESHRLHSDHSWNYRYVQNSQYVVLVLGSKFWSS